MKPDVDITIGSLKGRIIFYSDPALMARCCARISQVMVYNRQFELSEALGNETEIEAATVLREDVQEFLKIFKNHSLEEEIFIKRMQSLDFMISVDKKVPDGVILHELSHVLYYHDQEYRNAINNLWENLDNINKFVFSENMKDMGYKEVEYIDEWFAHLLYGFHHTRMILEELPAINDFYITALNKLKTYASTGTTGMVK